MGQPTRRAERRAERGGTALDEHPGASLSPVKDERGAQAAAYLRMLLVRAGEPRSIWVKHAPDARSGEIDTAAVADVLRDHAGARTVRAALDGTVLSNRTLELFIEAFRLSPRHASRLRTILDGSDSVRVVAGDTLADLSPSPGPPRHETLAAHELHTLGPDGLPAEHQTIQAIRSTVDGLTTHALRFDTDELVVEVVRGGRVGDLYRVDETLFGVDIVLDRPLAKGETALMHYRTTFGYRTPPPPELRRGTSRVMQDVTLWVQFHPDRLPARIWLARWDRLDHATVTEQHRVELDGEFSVQARYDKIEQVIVGFHWEWD
jgi:hypothetical protein